MPNILARTRAVSAILGGDFSSCGKHVGNVVNARELYVQHVNGGRDNDSDADSEEEDRAAENERYWNAHHADDHGSSDEDVIDDDAPSRVVNTLYEDLVRMAQGCTIRNDVSYTKVPDANDTFIRAAGELVIANGTRKFRDIMLPKGVPSAFGDVRNQETRVDKSVRVASEIKKFEWFTPSGEVIDNPARTFPEIGRIVTDISDRIMCIEDVQLTPHKLNMYGKNGFFRKHTDHPQNPATTIGTLVIVLPTEFSGGCFQLDQWRNDPVKIGQSDDVQACAFISTVPHEVNPVYSGCRVTLTYTIELMPRLPLVRIESRVLAESSDMQSIRKRLAMYFVRESVGLILEGTYTPEAVSKSGVDCLTSNSDIALASFIREELGVPVRLISIAYDFKSSNNAALELSDRDTYTTRVYQLSLAKWDRLFSTRSSTIGVEDDLVDGIESSEEEEEEEDEFVKHTSFFCNRHWAGGEEMMREEVQAIPFTGNEAQPGSFRCIHLQTALVFKVPQFGKKRTQTDDHTAPSMKKARTSDDSDNTESASV